VSVVAIIFGAVLIGFVLWDVFEVVILPRRVHRSFRPARYFHRTIWRLYVLAVGRMKNGANRETLLSFFGPLSLLMLIAVWAATLVLAYSLVYFGVGSLASSPHLGSGFTRDVYFSGTTFFTLGLGDVGPTNGASRVVTVLEAANGFGFLGLVIAYLPVFYQSFSRRETNISLLDARAGSPPTAGELLRRWPPGEQGADSLARFLIDSERWAAELLEGHLSYPILMFFRSQHERQSWVAALTIMLDTSAVVMTLGEGGHGHAARLTFAMARHAAVDLSEIFESSPSMPADDRLPPRDFERLSVIVAASKKLPDAEAWARKLYRLRQTYEPYVFALSRYLLMPLPPWVPAGHALDAWQTSRSEGSGTAESTQLE